MYLLPFQQKLQDNIRIMNKMSMKLLTCIKPDQWELKFW